MHENRTNYPARKVQQYVQLQDTLAKYRSVAIVRMEKIRASQVLQLRKDLKGEVEFVSIKNRVTAKALERSGVPGITQLIPNIQGQCMLLFTNMSPFRLGIILRENKVMLPARGGDIASVDVVVESRNTGIAPGPMLSEFKEANIPTKIDQGTIWIARDSVPVKKGEAINEKLAAMLGKLDIKPIEATLILDTAMEGGVQYTRAELSIDTEAVLNDVASAYQEALNLSVEAGYATPENIAQILAKASGSAHSLSAQSGYVTADTGDAVLALAHSHAVSLSGAASGYDPQ